ncbi:hypothetical protein [Actinoplanes sp. NPDC051494]
MPAQFGNPLLVGGDGSDDGRTVTGSRYLATVTGSGEQNRAIA